MAAELHLICKGWTGGKEAIVRRSRSNTNRHGWKNWGSVIFNSTVFSEFQEFSVLFGFRKFQRLRKGIKGSFLRPQPWAGAGALAWADVWSSKLRNIQRWLKCFRMECLSLKGFKNKPTLVLGGHFESRGLSNSNFDCGRNADGWWLEPWCTLIENSLLTGYLKARLYKK